jgi:hypothetical protein
LTIEIVIITDKEEQEVVLIIQTEIQIQTMLITLAHKERVAIITTTTHRRLITQLRLLIEAITVLGTGQIIIRLLTIAATVQVLLHGVVRHQVAQVVEVVVAEEVVVLVVHVGHVNGLKYFIHSNKPHREYLCGAY